MTSLHADRLTVKLAGRTLLEDVSLDASAGERVAVTGRSGSGKTTLLRTLAGALAPSAGSVTIAPASGRVALVPQEPVLLGALTVEENLEVFLRTAGVTAAEARELSARAVEEFLLGKVADRLAMELSGGEQQRLALARVATLRPEVLLVDEPTARQDADTRSQVVEALFAASREGILVIATHDPEITGMCDHVVTIDA